MSIKLLVIQNSPTASLGTLERCIRDYSQGIPSSAKLIPPRDTLGNRDRPITVEILTPAAGERLPINTDYDGLIVLGGPMNAEDDTHYPHLKDVVRLIQLFSAEHKPILGICLGAQLIARAFGQKIYQHNQVELGFTPLRGSGSAIASDPVLHSALPSNSEPIHLMQWHFDTFDLPEQATLLMTGDNCQNQAYRIHDNIYGFQCHFEVDRSILQGWLISGRDYFQSNHPDFPKQLEKQAALYLDRSNLFCHKVCHAWLDLIKVLMMT
ncbi:type 1 glutamine amidotransferase [Pleurocapsales cyanobacterium LEGE 10410]|nr:type 1 glutamine amidotransferase [Pleurocapsales cyanobacterium LEGE 10410]